MTETKATDEKKPAATNPTGGKSHKIAMILAFVAVFFALFSYVSKKQDLPGATKSKYGTVSPDDKVAGAMQEIRNKAAREVSSFAVSKKKGRKIRHADFGDELTQPKPPFGYSTLDINNNRRRDVIVYLADAYTGEVKRSAYVWGDGKYRHTLQQVGPGTYLIYYVTGSGWDNVLNTFSYPSGPQYLGTYHEFTEKHTRQGVEVTRASVDIEPPANPDEDVPEESFTATGKPVAIAINEEETAAILQQISKERDTLKKQ